MSLSLVTGGSGFIGQHLVDQLLARGETVRILDLEPPALSRAGVTFVQGSVTDPKAVGQAIQGARYVYHTAAIPHLWMPDPDIYREVNVEGTKTVFEAAFGAGVERILHTSSSCVLIGRHLERGPVLLDERGVLRDEDLLGHYARSKWQAERVAMGYADRMSVIVLMPTLPLGPGDGNMTPPTRMLCDVMNGKTPAFLDCLLNIVDVRDVAAGHVLACERGRPGERYLLNQHSIDMATFLRRLGALTGAPMPRWRIPRAAALCASAADETWSTLVSKRAPRAPFAGLRMALKRVRFDNSLAKSTFGFPATPLLKTLRDAVNWLAENDLIAAPPEKRSLALRA